ncbi:MAG TPA: mechanosensitive ion channel domain-containing protein [Rhodothermales bacterium]|nr:mechanosensitive ion channel domain-containing protein [Rhodothermales bacterium]
MTFSLLLLIFGLMLPQQIPPDTTRPVMDTLAVADSQTVADTQAVILPAGDSTQISPLPDPPAVLLPLPDLGADTLSPQVRPDTTDAPSPDTAAATPDSLSQDTLGAQVPPPPQDTGEEPPVTELLDEAAQELQRMQQSLNQQLLQFRQTFTLMRLLLVILALALTYLLVRLATWTLERLAHWRPMQAYRFQRITPFVRFAIWFVALWLLFGSLFARSTLVLVLLVLLVMIAIGVTLFQFLRDLIGGLVLIFEQPFQIGSRITIGEQEGLVRRIGLRSFKMVRTDGTFVIVPNAEVLRRSIAVTPPSVPEAPVSVELPVPAGVAVEQAQAWIREATYASPYCCAAKPISVTLAVPDAPDDAVRFQVDAYVFDAAYAHTLTSDVLRFTRERFAAAQPMSAPDG